MKIAKILSLVNREGLAMTTINNITILVIKDERKPIYTVSLMNGQSIFSEKEHSFQDLLMFNSWEEYVEKEGKAYVL